MSIKLPIFEPPSTPTRAFGPQIAEAIKNGKTVYRADIGMPQEPYPRYAQTALKHVIDKMPIAGYGPEIDPELSRSLAGFYKKKFFLPVEENDISKSLIAGLGASELFFLTLLLITKTSDQIFSFDPHYANFDVPISSLQRRWLVGKTDENFHPKIDDLEQELEKDKKQQIKVLYLNSPHNPTGAVYTKDEIKQLIDLALKYQLWLIWDGVYWNYNYSQNPSSILELLQEYDLETRQTILNQLIVLDSASKTFFLCEWRLGWAIVFNQQLRQALSNMVNYRGNVSIQYQKALSQIFNLPEIEQILAKNQQLYQNKRNLMWQALQSLIDESLVSISQPPEGSIYFTLKLAQGLSAEDFLIWSLNNYQGNEITTFVPLKTQTGSFFGQNNFPQDQQSYLRLCFGLPEEKIVRACQTFSNQLKAYLKANGRT